MNADFRDALFLVLAGMLVVLPFYIVARIKARRITRAVTRKE